MIFKKFLGAQKNTAPTRGPPNLIELRVFPFGPAQSKPVACAPRFLPPGRMLQTSAVTGGLRTAGLPFPCPALAEVRIQPVASRLFPSLTSHPAARFRSLLPVCNLSELLLPSTVPGTVPGAGPFLTFRSSLTQALSLLAIVQPT
jgi:hypothetical protein